MSNFGTIKDWIEIHTNGTCDKADDCLISLAQAMQKSETAMSKQEKGTMPQSKKIDLPDLSETHDIVDVPKAKHTT